MNSSVIPDVSESTTRKRDREEINPSYDFNYESSPPAQRSSSSSSTSHSFADVDTSSDYVSVDMKQCLKCDESNTLRAVFCCSCRNEF